MASLSTCHLGLWLGWQILLNLTFSSSSATGKLPSHPVVPPGHRLLTTQRLWQVLPQTLLAIRGHFSRSPTTFGINLLQLMRDNIARKKINAFLGALRQRPPPKWRGQLLCQGRSHIGNKGYRTCCLQFTLHIPRKPQLKSSKSGNHVVTR